MIQFVFEGDPVPYVRMNHQNRWTERVQNYLGYKRLFAEALAVKFPHLVDHGPSTALKKERAAWLRTHKHTRYRLDFIVYESREKGDWDNYGKVIGDALQDAGLVVNDKKIKTGSWDVRVDAARPRIEFEMKRMEEIQ